MAILSLPILAKDWVSHYFFNDFLLPLEEVFNPLACIGATSASTSLEPEMK